MAINEVLQPGSTAPTTNNDYTYQNNNIDIGLIPKLSIFSNWEDTTIEPVIAQGTFLYMGGKIYECQTSNEAIAGTPAAGINYIVATVTGSVMTLAWSTSKAGYLFNPQYGGNYSGATQILLDICYKDGTAFRRARSLGMDLNNFYLANGSIWFSGGLITNSNPIDAGTGALTCGNIACDNINGNDITGREIQAGSLAAPIGGITGYSVVQSMHYFPLGTTYADVHTALAGFNGFTGQTRHLSGSYGVFEVRAGEKTTPFTSNIKIYYGNDDSTFLTIISGSATTLTANLLVIL